MTDSRAEQVERQHRGGSAPVPPTPYACTESADGSRWCVIHASELRGETCERWQRLEPAWVQINASKPSPVNWRRRGSAA